MLETPLKQLRNFYFNFQTHLYTLEALNELHSYADMTIFSCSVALKLAMIKLITVQLFNPKQLRKASNGK